jgi:hypothetical protein
MCVAATEYAAILSDAKVEVNSSTGLMIVDECPHLRIPCHSCSNGDTSPEHAVRKIGSWLKTENDGSLAKKRHHSFDLVLFAA